MQGNVIKMDPKGPMPTWTDVKKYICPPENLTALQYCVPLTVTSTKLYTDISAAQLPLYIETLSNSCAILINITYTSHMLELRLIGSPSFHIPYHFGILCLLLLIRVTLYKPLKISSSVAFNVNIIPVCSLCVCFSFKGCISLLAHIFAI